MTLVANWSYPNAIRFGAGRIAEIGEACVQSGISRPLLVTDRGLKDMEITQRTLDLMDKAGLGRAMFAEVDPNPNEQNLEAGLKVYRDGGHDGVIAFGGGSGLDLGKMVAFMRGQTGRCGTSRTLATGGRGPTLPASTPSSRCRPRQAPDQRWAAPASSPIRRRT
jgi:alcohol dehydrogenase class IV